MIFQSPDALLLRLCLPFCPPKNWNTGENKVPSKDVRAGLLASSTLLAAAALRFRDRVAEEVGIHRLNL